MRFVSLVTILLVMLSLDVILVPYLEFGDSALSPQNTNLSVISSISLNKTPLCIALNSETNRVYVGVQGGIIIIDGVTKQILTTIPFFNDILNQSLYPEWIVVDLKTDRLFVAGVNDKIYVFDGKTNTLEGTINFWGAERSEIAFDFNRSLIYIASPTEWVYNSDYIIVFNATTLSDLSFITIPGSYGLSARQRINVAFDSQLNRIYAAWTHNATIFSFNGFNYTNVLKTKENAFSSLPNMLLNPLTNILYLTSYSSTLAYNGSSLEFLNLPDIGTIAEIDPGLPIIYALKSNSTNTGQNLNVADGFSHKILASVNLGGLGDGVALQASTGELYITQKSFNRTLVVLDATVPRGSIVINGGGAYTTSTGVTLTLTSSDAGSGVDQVRYSDDGLWDTEPWENASATKPWTLPSGDGTKTVYYQIKDKAGLLSATYSDTIILDTTVYLITVTQSANGVITPGTSTVNYEYSQNYNITANAGYHIVDVQVDNVNRGAVSSFTFTNVTGTHSISASFAINTYTITVTQTANGLISPGTTSVNYGSNQAFTITPNSGYNIATITTDGGLATVTSPSGQTISFSNVKSSHTLTATFVLAPLADYMVSAVAGSGGSISPHGDMFTTPGTSYTFTITPNSGYRILDVLDNGVSKGSQSSYTLTNIHENHQITASFSTVPTPTTTPTITPNPTSTSTITSTPTQTTTKAPSPLPQPQLNTTNTLLFAALIIAILAISGILITIKLKKIK
jgi:hypothetical protein